MRPIIQSNATKVLIATFAVILSFAGFAEARDRSGERHYIRRPHHERPQRDRSETLSGVTARHNYNDDRRDRRPGKNYLIGRTADRGYVHGRNGFDRRFAFERRPDRRPNRQIIVRDFNGQGQNYWEPGYGSSDFPSATGAGTYFGGLSAWNDPGNGTYFRSEGRGYGYYGDDNPGGAYRAPRPKIIRVNPSTAGRACAWEAGVCIIRR